MDIVLYIILFLNAYVIIYFRLNIKHYYEKENKLAESNFGALFSFPPYSKLSVRGKIYFRRYWTAIILMFGIIFALVAMRDNSGIKPLTKPDNEYSVTQ